MKKQFNINNICSKIREIIEPKKIILFGSQATNTNTDDSDIDLLILMKSLKDRRKIYTKLRYHLYKSNEITPMDIIIQDYDRYYELIDNPCFIYKKINEEGVVLYG